MLDIKYVVANQDAVAKNCEIRNVKANVPAVVQLYTNRNATIVELESNRAAANANAKSMKEKVDPSVRQQRIEDGKRLKVEVSRLEDQLQTLESQLDGQLRALPNLTHPDVPVGNTDDDHKVLRHVGEPKQFDFVPQDHVALAEKLGLVDFEAGAKVAGQKFYFLKNELVYLDMALQRYALDKAVARGYRPVTTPDLAKPSILEGIGFNPRGAETQVYSIADQDLCLVGTAEITIGGMLAGETLDDSELPIRIAGISHCFRTEAGSAGRESRGLYRVHQFTKVEMFVFCKGDNQESEALHQELLQIEEDIFSGLGIPYRVLDIASGDLGAPAYRKFDIEAWMPGRGAYGEVTSTSNCTDYQSRRLGIRHRSSGEKSQFVHTLNGTAVATSRALIAVLENYQQADGSVKVPEVLRPYLPFDKIG